MAYKRINAAQVDSIQAWLVSQVHWNGAVWDPAADIETSETDGEVLLALATR